MPINTKKERKAENVERDPRLFVWFMTLVLVSVYAVSLNQRTVLFQSWQFWILSVLLLGHILLHWNLEKILVNQAWSTVYWFMQGVLGFVICWLAGNEGMIFAIFMALIGEVVGVYGLKLVTFIFASYYMVLGYFNLRMIMTLGTSSWILLGIVPVVIFVITYVSLYMRQLEAREKAQTLAMELEKANQQLSEYAAQVEDLSIANERQRMARELHDTLSQGLTGIILQLEAVEAHLANDRVEKANTIIRNAMGQARSTLADARNVIDDLRREHLDDLEATLRFEVSRFKHATDIACELELKNLDDIPQVVQEALLRNISEGLTNIASHAQASYVKVRVVKNEGELQVLLADDGCGFDVQNIPSGHYGLIGLRERVASLGGKITVESETGKGTRLEMSIPL
jgi:NarL family two-component system sensor histidine kinase YdfH